MASFLRAKQSGIDTDLSAGLRSDLFAVDQLSRLGISSQISALAIDPVQSLLAIGTRTTQANPGQIYIFGQKRVCVALPLAPGGASVDVLQFARDCLICLDSKHNLNIFSLKEKKLLGTFSAPGVVTSICTDPSLDYCLLGLNTGDVIGYDIDRLCLTRFRISNLWHEIDPRARMTPVVALQFHPRDLGQLLCGYSTGAAIYSFKENKALRHYEVLPRASGRGMAVPHGRLTHARWHPSGTFILTAHEESSAIITIWDVLKDGRPITRLELGISILRSISWCANGTNPDDTGLFIAGSNKLLWRSFGPTPIYATSSYESLGAFFNSPKDVRELPIPPGAEIAEYCLIPRTSPWFAGASDPLAVLLLLDTGEMLTLSFPSGIPISPTNQLPLALSFVHPFLNNFSVTAVERERWLGLKESRSQGPLLVKGGVEAPHNMMRYEKRNVVAAAHGDGLVRLWDMGHGDELENDAVIQCDVARATGRTDRVGITQTSLSAESCEFAVGTHEGEVLVFRWGRSRGAREQAGNRPRQLTPIDGRVDPTLKEGMLPLTLLDQQNGPVTAVKVSDVGFVAAAFGGSELVLIDLRGPAIILQTSVKEFSQDKGRSKRKGSVQADNDYGTQLDFSVMTLEGDSWSSILLHCGTHAGHLGTYRIIPDPSGRYSCQFVSSVFLESKIIYMHAINNAHGRAAAASQQAVAALRSGERTDGSLVAVTATAVHILKPGSTKTGAHKSFSDAFCDAAGVGRYQDRGHAVIALLGDSTARAYSIPALKELAVLRLNGLDFGRFKDARVTSAGNIVAFSSPSELSLLGVFGTGAPLVPNADTLWNPALLLPPRPTVSMVSWVTGTQYVTPLDLDTLIGGPGRPPSKRAIEQAQAEDAQRRTGTGAAGQGAPEGYLAYAQRQLAERTANMNIVGDSMNSLQDASQTWLNDVNKYVSSSKKAAATGIIKARFGL